MIINYQIEKVPYSLEFLSMYKDHKQHETFDSYNKNEVIHTSFVTSLPLFGQFQFSDKFHVGLTTLIATFV